MAKAKLSNVPCQRCADLGIHLDDQEVLIARLVDGNWINDLSASGYGLELKSRQIGCTRQPIGHPYHYELYLVGTNSFFTEGNISVRITESCQLDAWAYDMAVELLHPIRPTLA